MRRLQFILTLNLLTLSLTATASGDFSFNEHHEAVYPDSDGFLTPTIPQRFLDEANDSLIVHLNDEDYQAAAERLGVEVAAIKAVVEIETGRQRIGFCAPRKPIIYFDAKVFNRSCSRKGISLDAWRGKIKSGHGVNQTQAHRRLQQAVEIDSVTAVESTFWGMFQIGGFNWKLCGATDIHDFVKRMEYSERTQLELFVQFLINTNLAKYLREKNWSAFAYRYNGPKYARRGYHTRLARAYRKHSHPSRG